MHGSSSACGSIRAPADWESPTDWSTWSNHARAEGAACLVLWVTEVNDRARAFYQRIGFVPTGARQLVRPSEPGLWEEQMIRHLG